MDLEKMLESYRADMMIKPREERVEETIQKSGEIFLEREQERMLNYAEFLKIQFTVLRKRWWLYQCLLLTASGLVLGYMQEEYFIRRSVGVAGVLFVVLIIPEMWKNRTHLSMEVETAAYYSLRQIYAARMMLFGIADTFLLTLFCGSVSFSLGVAFKELLVQFLFPLCVTACICFGTLCSRHILQEAVAVGLCILWSGVWLLIILNEHIYTNITLPVWAFLWGLALVSLFFFFYRVLAGCNKYWEVSLDGIEI